MKSRSRVYLHKGVKAPRLSKPKEFDIVSGRR